MSFSKVDVVKDGNLIEGPPDNETLKSASWSDVAVYIIGGFGIYLLASILLASLMREMSLWMTVSSALLDFLCLGGSVYLFGILRKKVSWSSMGLVGSNQIFKWALWGVAAAVAILPLRFLAIAAGLIMEYLIHGDIASLNYRGDFLNVGMDTWYGVVLMVVGVGILAPIAEELFFRGLLYDWFKQKFGVQWGIGFSALLFGLAHYDSLAVIGSAFVMGMALAYAYEKTQSLWISIFMHISTNTGAILLVAFLTQFGEILQSLQY